MSLSELYGEGADEEFRKAVSMPELFPESTVNITSSTKVNHSVHVETFWSNPEGQFGYSIQDFYPLRVHYTTLRLIETSQNKGFYKAQILKAPLLYHKWGIRAMTAYPHGPHQEWLLALGGFQWQEWLGILWFAVRLDITSRMAEYREWIKAGEPEASEPLWHKELREMPVPDAELLLNG